MKARRQQGFTLIEVLTVIIIIGILTSILLPVVTVVRTRIRAAATKADIAAFGTAAEAFKSDAGIYPPDDYSNAGICGYIFGVVPTDTSLRITANASKIVKDPANDSTRGLTFWLGGTFWVQAKGYGPYLVFKQNRLAAVTPTTYCPISGTTLGTRWSVVGIGPVQSNARWLIYSLQDWFGNSYVYDSHVPESKVILGAVPGPNGASSDIHNSSSFDMYSFGPAYNTAQDGTIDDYDSPPPYPGEAADDINNWQ